MFVAAIVVLLAVGFASLRYGAGMIRGATPCALEMETKWRNADRFIVMNVSNQSTFPIYAVSRIVPSETSLRGSPSLLTPITVIEPKRTIEIQSAGILPAPYYIERYVTGCAFANPSLGIDDYEYALPLDTQLVHVAQPTDGSPHPTHTDVLTYAVDFDTPLATVVLAAREGTVAHVFDESGWSCLPFQSLTGSCTKYSNIIVIRHSDGTEAVYGHLLRHSATVGVGQSVRRGEIIAKSGRTGTRGPHLHFAIHTLDTTTGENRTIPFRLVFRGHRFNNNTSLLLESGVRDPKIAD